MNFLLISFQAFGAPTFVIHVNGKKEMIFGSDRFPILARILGKSLGSFHKSFLAIVDVTAASLNIYHKLRSFHGTSCQS